MGGGANEISSNKVNFNTRRFAKMQHGIEKTNYFPNFVPKDP